MLRKNTLTTLLLFTIYLSPCSSIAADKLSSLENRIIDDFTQFCLENTDNFQKLITQAKANGYPEEKNEYVVLQPGDHRWTIYTDDKQNIRMRLILQKNTCAISAITNKTGHPPPRENQTPIERFLMNTMHATLVTRQQDEHYEQRTYDAHYQGRAYTIILRNEIQPAKSVKDTFFYQTILRVIPQ